MLLPSNTRRLLLMFGIPLLLTCIVAVVVSPNELRYVWPFLVVSITLVLSLWADGRTGRARRRYRRIGMILTAPSLALWIFMLTGIYFYQGPRSHLRFGNGQIQMHFGSAAALAPQRIPLSPKHTSLGGNWSKGYTHGWRGTGMLALTSLGPLLMPPSGSIFGITLVNSAGVPVTFFDLPVTALLVLTGLPTLMLMLGRDPAPARPGHCEKCQYDLIGNTSGVCSECGAKIDTGQRVAVQPPPGRA